MRGVILPLGALGAIVLTAVGLGACGGGDRDVEIGERREIAFVRQGPDATLSIYAMNADGSGMIRLTDEPGKDIDPAFAPDGQRIAFVRWDRNADIYLMNADGSEQTNLTATAGSQETDPAFSPDGQRIAFVRDVGSLRGGIYTMNPDGTDLIRLTNPASLTEGPTWSPDGQQIAFSRSNEDPQRERDVYVMNADGSGQRKLTNYPAGDASPAWSPDGRRIAFLSNRGGPTRRLTPNAKPVVYVMDADGTNERRVTEPPGPDGASAPAWSPDGQRIAFDCLRGAGRRGRDVGSTEICVTNADGSGREVSLTARDGLRFDQNPTWSPASDGSS